MAEVTLEPLRINVKIAPVVGANTAVDDDHVPSIVGKRRQHFYEWCQRSLPGARIVGGVNGPDTDYADVIHVEVDPVVREQGSKVAACKAAPVVDVAAFDGMCVAKYTIGNQSDRLVEWEFLWNDNPFEQI